MKNICSFIICVLAFANTATVFGSESKGSDTYRAPKFESQVKRYLEMDKLQKPKENGVVIVGSSSVLQWQDRIHTDFSKVKVIARGFGGSNMNDLLYYAEDLVIKHNPRAVVIYEGDNDTSDKLPPIVIANKFVEVANKLREKRPATRIYVISVKPSISRWNLWPKMVEVNQILEAICNSHDSFTFIDVSKVLLDSEGQPKKGIFKKDNLHLNQAGYDLWAKMITDAVESQESQYEN